MSTCPTITADGEPCGAACDAFAECFSASPGIAGTCTLLDSVVCK